MTTKPLLLSALHDTNVLDQEIEEVKQAFRRKKKQIEMLQNELKEIEQELNAIPPEKKIALSHKRYQLEKKKKHKQFLLDNYRLLPQYEKKFLDDAYQIQQHLQLQKEKQNEELIKINKPMIDSIKNELGIISNKRKIDENVDSMNKSKQQKMEPFDDENKQKCIKWNDILKCSKMTIDTEQENDISSSLSSEHTKQINDKKTENVKQLTTENYLIKLKTTNLLSDVISTPTYHFKQICTQPNCNEPLISIASESKLVCPKCSISQDMIDPSFTHYSSFTGNEADNTSYEYKREYHLLDLIEMFRPREHEVIDPVKKEKLKAEIRKRCFTLNKDLTVHKVQNFLKELKFNDLYKYRYQLTMELNGKQCPVMSEQLETLILLIFQSMQSVFERIKKNRSSFLKFEFTVYHICKMLGCDEFLPFLRRLENQKRHRNQIRLLRQVFKELGFTYRPRL